MKCLLAIVMCLCSTAWCADSEKSWRLTTDDTMVEVAVKNGVPVILHVGTAKDSANWLLAAVPEILLESVAQPGGNSVPTKWQYQSGDFDPKSGELVLRFSNAAPALELQSIWRARPGRGPVEHWLTIANNSGTPRLPLGHQDQPGPEPHRASRQRIAGRLVDQARRGQRYASKAEPSPEVWEEIPSETLTSNPNDGASPVPWLALQAGTSHGLYVGWEFSGIGRIHYQSVGADLKACGMILPPAPDWYGSW